MKRLGLFAFTGLSGERLADPHVLHLLHAARPLLDRLIVVTAAGQDHGGIAAIAGRMLTGPAAPVKLSAHRKVSPAICHRPGRHAPPQPAVEPPAPWQGRRRCQQDDPRPPSGLWQMSRSLADRVWPWVKRLLHFH